MTKKQWKENALAIGQSVCDIYGATVEDVEINEKGLIIVYGDDHGDKFSCTFTPNEWSQQAKEAGVI